MYQQPNRSQIIGLGFIALLLIVLLLALPSMLFNGIRPVSLAKASQPFSGTIAQTLGTNTEGRLPTEGKDFSIQSVKYFESNQWVIVTIHRSNVSESAYVILQENHGVFTIVLGPGTSFSKSSTAVLPADLNQFLNVRGLIYATGN